MLFLRLKISILIVLIGIPFIKIEAQKLIPFKLAGTGQYTSYTTTHGEDADFIINPMSFTDNGDGTITDNNTRLMWQKTDGGEMTIGNAVNYCNNLTLAGYSDWRLPTNHELFSINNYENLNPALDTVIFSNTHADYWWTSEKEADDTTKIWVVNAGGGIGAHPKSETYSAGGTHYFHVRAVRDLITTTFAVQHFTDNGNGTITDNYTGLMWQKNPQQSTMTWLQALAFANSTTLAGKTDWRVPNVKELQSLNDVNIFNPSIDTNYLKIVVGDYWSSTTLYLTATKVWDMNLFYGIVTQHYKTLNEYVILVRGGKDKKDLNFSEALIPAGVFSMGDHFGFVDPGHPSDEIPLHNVSVDSFYMSINVTTNQQYMTFLNSYLSDGLIHDTINKVYLVGDTNTLFLTNQFASYYNIGYNGNAFYLSDFRAYHPVVGVMWSGAAVFCNWLSTQNGLQPCYNLQTWACDFNQNGYRLPTEAEWEYAGRGGHLNPYFQYPNGDTADVTKANLPSSGDPYEASNYPLTTPVGFYDGTLKLKSDYAWPDTASSFQTSNGANGYGLYDMQGNVWEFINDWYSQTYYSISPSNNPQGPSTGSLMPDGKPYRGMRGGNWYNGDMVYSVNDGHSRISNRDPSYFRGPQDPNHPWYHVGFRVVRKASVTNGIGDHLLDELRIEQNYPNPFNKSTFIKFSIPKRENIKLEIYNSIGERIAVLANNEFLAGLYTIEWKCGNQLDGIYFLKAQTDDNNITKKMILIK